MDVYAAYCVDEDIRLKSSSGGMITILAEHVLDQGGVVYGVAMSDDCYAAEFIRVTDRNGLEKIRGSKYLQAKVGVPSAGSRKIWNPVGRFCLQERVVRSTE